MTLTATQLPSGMNRINTEVLGVYEFTRPKNYATRETVQVLRIAFKSRSSGMVSVHEFTTDQREPDRDTCIVYEGYWRDDVPLALNSVRDQESDFDPESIKRFYGPGQVNTGYAFDLFLGNGVSSVFIRDPREHQDVLRFGRDNADRLELQKDTRERVVSPIRGAWLVDHRRPGHRELLI